MGPDADSENGKNSDTQQGTPESGSPRSPGRGRSQANLLLGTQPHCRSLLPQLYLTLYHQAHLTPSPTTQLAD